MDGLSHFGYPAGFGHGYSKGVHAQQGQLCPDLHPLLPPPPDAVQAPAGLEPPVHSLPRSAPSLQPRKLLALPGHRSQVAGCKFRRQQVLGPYIVDFACLEEKLVIELDGGQHAEQRSYDEHRTRWLEQGGFRVLRFWDHQVFQELDAVLRVVANELGRPPPGLRPTSPTRRT